MRYRYVTEHNNYDLTLCKEYHGYKYKDGWVLIKDDNDNSILYREECFEKAEMICDICEKRVKPLDAHMGKLQDKLITAHIECWNKKIKEEYSKCCNVPITRSPKLDGQKPYCTRCNKLCEIEKKGSQL